MNKCALCGKQIKPQFHHCYDCHLKMKQVESYFAYLKQTPEERERELEDYYSNECVMCGKEGASERTDGKNYCSHCWIVWNS